jgi:pimeloyl-ACP methyl ester carboxylesterase
MRKVAGLEYDTRGDGEPVLFIHGAIIADSFAPVMGEPTLAGYRLIRYRRRGYGRSEPPSDPPTIQEHARDARALLDRLGAERTHVVAHSGGGPIAVQLAIDAPQVVRSLVLLEPVLQTAEMAAAFDELVAPLVEMHRAGDSSKAVHLWMRPVGGSDWRTEIEKRIPGAGDRANDDAGGTFGRDGDLPALRHWDFDAVGAQTIEQPVLNIVGSRSAGQREVITPMLCAAVPHTDVVVIDDADHTLPMTRPTPIAQEIAGFLGRHPI